ncbi:MAG: phosphotransferase family protein [Promethearchaeota archaeon]
MNNGNKEISVGKITIPLADFYELLERGKREAGLEKDSTCTSMDGPFDGKINTIYKLDFLNATSPCEMIFRARISEAFRYENIVKEKILFPILDGTVDLSGGKNLESQIDAIIKKDVGSYLLERDNDPIMPVQDLYYYDESRQHLPYMYSILSFVPGISLYDLIEREGLKGTSIAGMKTYSKKKLENSFTQAGEYMGRYHGLEFPGFYNSILDIGKHEKQVNWKDLFLTKVDTLIAEASRYPNMKATIPKLKKYFKENEGLIPDDEIAVLFHNDYQPQNFIIDDTTGSINGIIDFDNWQIGTKEQDFIKIQYWGLRELDQHFERCFMKGYRKHQKIDADFQDKVNLYKMQWFILVFNFEMDKVAKSEQNITVDSRFPGADQYLGEINKIIDGTR